MAEKLIKLMARRPIYDAREQRRVEPGEEIAVTEKEAKRLVDKGAAEAPKEEPKRGGRGRQSQPKESDDDQEGSEGGGE